MVRIDQSAPTDAIKEKDLITSKGSVDPSKTKNVGLKALICIGAAVGVIAGAAVSLGGVAGVVVLTGLAIGSASLTLGEVFGALVALGVTLGSGALYLLAKVMEADKNGVIGAGAGVVFVPLAIGGFTLPIALPLGVACAAALPGIGIGYGSISLSAWGWEQLSKK